MQTIKYKGLILTTAIQIKFNKKPYSASAIFITHGIPSFHELLRTSIYRFTDRVSKNSNSIVMACMTLILYITLPFGNGGDQCYVNLYYFYFVIFYYYYYYYCTYICFNTFLYVYGPCVCNIDILYYYYYYYSNVVYNMDWNVSFVNAFSKQH